MSAADSARPGLPPEVVVYGVAGYTLPLLAVLRETGVRVRCVVDQQPEADPGTPPGFDPYPVRAGVGCQAVPIAPADEFFAEARSGGCPVPVIAASIESEYHQRPEDDPFRRAADAVRDGTGGAVTLWHPASLVGTLPIPPVPGRFALIAYPGSGNVLALNILGELAARAAGPMPETARWASGFVEHLFVTTSNLFRARLAGLGVTEFGFNTAELPTMAVGLALPGGGQAVVRNVPSNRHHAQFAYHSHATPSGWAAAEFARLGAPVFVVVRHPFETVLSLASKFRRPPGPVLDDPAWVGHEAREMAEWYRRLAAHGGDATVVRYEDLVARDPRPVRAMAGRLGVPVDDAEAGRLYDRFLNRNLSDAQQGHFHRGGNDKWRGHFGRRHRDPFRRAGLRPVFDRWGYDGLDAVGDPPAREDGPAEAFPVQKMGAVAMAYWRRPEYEVLPGPIPYELRSTCPGAAAALRGVLLGDELRELLNAGGVGPEPPPWAGRVDWDEVARATVRGPAGRRAAA